MVLRRAVYDKWWSCDVVPGYRVLGLLASPLLGHIELAEASLTKGPLTAQAIVTTDLYLTPGCQDWSLILYCGLVAAETLQLLSRCF